MIIGHFQTNINVLKVKFFFFYEKTINLIRNINQIQIIYPFFHFFHYNLLKVYHLIIP